MINIKSHVLIARIIQSAYVNLDHQLFVKYEDYEIEIERDDENSDWSFLVRTVDYTYRTCWLNSKGKSKEDALRQVLEETNFDKFHFKVMKSLDVEGS